jgi:hypothetical protein
MARRELTDEAGVLAALPGLSRRQLRELRLRRKIPYIRVSYRHILYDIERVITALERLELHEVGGRK